MVQPNIDSHQTLLAVARSVFLGALLLGCEMKPPSREHVDGDRALLATTDVVATMMEAVVGRPVQQLIAGGANATTWSPSEVELEMMAKGFLVSNGRGFEATLKKYDLPRSTWLRSANKLTDPPILHDVVEHQHGPNGAHSHGDVDGHTWVDPMTAMSQLEIIRERLVQEGFCTEAESRQNSADLIQYLQEIHDQFAVIETGKVMLYANQPAYDYLARSFGWTIKSFDLPPEGPLAKEVFQTMKEQPGPKVMVLTAPPSLPFTEALAELEVQTVVLSLGTDPTLDGGWPQCLKVGAERLQEVLSRP